MHALMHAHKQPNMQGPNSARGAGGGTLFVLRLAPARHGAEHPQRAEVVDCTQVRAEDHHHLPRCPELATSESAWVWYARRKLPASAGDISEEAAAVEHLLDGAVHQVRRNAQVLVHVRNRSPSGTGSRNRSPSCTLAACSLSQTPPGQRRGRGGWCRRQNPRGPWMLLSCCSISLGNPRREMQRSRPAGRSCGRIRRSPDTGPGWSSSPWRNTACARSCRWCASPS
mmetsp:Transcript_3092/g.9438  ORF Transcript_3092/g.9438 Transcript_3092/m.9438 type:complete len:227 (-) Transcript_3092:1430-2110(-)